MLILNAAHVVGTRLPECCCWDVEVPIGQLSRTAAEYVMWCRGNFTEFIRERVVHAGCAGARVKVYRRTLSLCRWKNGSGPSGFRAQQWGNTYSPEVSCVSARLSAPGCNVQCRLSPQMSAWISAAEKHLFCEAVGHCNRKCLEDLDDDRMKSTYASSCTVKVTLIGAFLLQSPVTE